MALAKGWLEISCVSCLVGGVCVGWMLRGLRLKPPPVAEENVPEDDSSSDSPPSSPKSVIIEILQYQRKNN